MPKLSKDNKEWLLLFIGIVVYSGLVFITPVVKGWSWKYLNIQEVLPYIFGYTFAVVLAHWPIKKVRDAALETILARNAQETKSNKFYARPYYACVVGIIERPLYIASLQMGYPEFIALWIGAKIAGGWKGWENQNQGRDIFNAFMVGNALSLGYAVWGFQVTKWFYTDSYKGLISAISGIIILSSWAIAGYFQIKGRKWLKEFNSNMEETTKEVKKRP